MREQAEYLRIALAMGLIDPSEVVAWADRMIAVLDEPPIELINVSLAGSRLPTEILDLLRAIPGVGDLARAAHRALALLLQRFRAGSIPVGRAVEMLWAYSNWAYVPEGERLRAANFSDALFCAREGYCGSVEGVRVEIEEFLVEYSIRSSIV